MYVEKLPKAWSIACITTYLAVVSYLGFKSIPEDTGPWLAVSGLFLLLLAPCLGIPVSKYIFHRIRIENGVLRVGREKIPLTDLDSASVQAAHQAEIPSPTQRLQSSLQNIDAPLPGLRAGSQRQERLVGGAWGVPMGMDSVVIATRKGEKLCIATRDRAAFLTALLTAVRNQPTRGE